MPEKETNKATKNPNPYLQETNIPDGLKENLATEDFAREQLHFDPSRNLQNSINISVNEFLPTDNLKSEQLVRDTGMITASPSKHYAQYSNFTAITNPTNPEAKLEKSLRQDGSPERASVSKKVEQFTAEYLEKQGSEAKNSELDKWAEERRRIEEILNGNYFGNTS